MEVKEKTISIRRVAKVVKGGRRFSFSAVVAVGDGAGKVGYGLGKANEVPEALKKATEQAKRSMITVPIAGSTLPYDVLGKYGSTRVVMRPSKPGSGVIAGSIVRSIFVLAGVSDVCTKRLGSNNPLNVLNAVFAGFRQLHNVEEVKSLLGRP